MFIGFIGNAFAAPIDTEIKIKNRDASYVNRGQFSIAFDLTAQGYLDNVENIDFSVIVKDKNGKKLMSDVISASDFDMVGGKTYANFFLEGEDACDVFGETLLITKAIVNYSDGTKSEDIIKSKKLVVDDFKPMKIVVGLDK